MKTVNFMAQIANMSLLLRNIPYQAIKICEVDEDARDRVNLFAAQVELALRDSQSNPDAILLTPTLRDYLEHHVQSLIKTQRPEILALYKALYGKEYHKP